MDEIKNIIRALRCQNTAGSECIGKDCPYFITSTRDEREKFFKMNNVDPKLFPDDFFNGCDFEKTGLDAAEKLEALLRFMEDDGK